MTCRSKRRRGNTVVEFTLVGIPLIFVLVSTFEVARGMWLYHTLAHSVKQATRFASVHGQNCTKGPNTCSVTVGQITQMMRSEGTGLDASKVNVVFTDSTGTSLACGMSACLADSTMWPPSNANAPGMRIRISATYRFRSAICMFWPGATRQGPGPALNFPASSTQTIQF